MDILLLPGADGTGVLFQPFLQCLTGYDDGTLNVTVVNLNKDKQGALLNQRLSVQAEYIESNFIQSANITISEKLSNPLNTQPVVVIAESYSGLLAYELLKRGHLNIAYVVFVASFLNCPSKLATLTPVINPAWLKTTLQIVPKSIWGRVVFGQWQTTELHALFIEAMSQTPDNLLKQRLKIISTAKAPSQKIDVPCLYLQASDDNLVPADNIKVFQSVFTNFDWSVVEGSHFLLQTNPKKVVERLLTYDVFNY